MDTSGSTVRRCREGVDKPEPSERVEGACGAAHGMHEASHLHPPISLSLQAAEAEEQRLKAIAAPYYVDHALCFLAIVQIEHKYLPGTYCTYKSWPVCVL